MKTSDRVLNHHSFRVAKFLKVPDIMRAYCVNVHAEKLELTLLRDCETNEIYGLLRTRRV